MIGSSQEALAIELCKPLLAGIAGGECSVFLAVDCVATGLVSLTNAEPIGCGEAIGQVSVNWRLGKYEARQADEDEDNGFHLGRSA